MIKWTFLLHAIPQRHLPRDALTQIRLQSTKLLSRNRMYSAHDIFITNIAGNA